MYSKAFKTRSNHLVSDSNVLDMLEELKNILDIYNPIMYESSEQSKELSEKIPQLYGAVETVYKQCTGNLKVKVKERGGFDIFPNYFEAGYLSGSSIHSHTGYQELLKVMGRIKAEGIIQNSINSESEAITNILTIIKRFHQVTRQIRSRYSQRPTIEIEDEYDVQDLFHSLLKLYFDDIRPEEYTPSYAGSASRVDFLLKEEKIIIEIKKTRKGLNGKIVGEQLIIDSQRYQSHPDCGQLICFVYDPEGRISNPRGIENDLSKELNGIPISVYISPEL